VSSIKPNDGSDHIDSREEDFGAFIVAGREGAVLFESGKEILAQMPRFLELLIIRPLDCPMGFWRNDGGFAGLLQRFEHPRIRIEGFIGNDDICGNRRQ
jgi:hypothetical protein